MSAVHTTPERKAPEGADRKAPEGGPDRRSSSLLRRIVGGTAVAAVITAGTIALWPASDAEIAREDGEQLGEAVAQLYNADTKAEAEAALVEIDEAVAESREHAGDRVGDQAEEQADALDRAVDGFVGANSTDDAFEADLYEAELEVALDDLVDNASDYREDSPEVHQAYWEGFEEGLDNGITTD